MHDSSLGLNYGYNKLHAVSGVKSSLDRPHLGYSI